MELKINIHYFWCSLSILFLPLNTFSVENLISLADLDNTPSWSWVTVEGKVISKIESEEYRLRDSSGEGIVQINESLIENIAVGKLVRVIGMTKRGIVEAITVKIGEKTLLSRNKPRHIRKAKELSLDLESYQPVRERKGYRIRSGIYTIIASYFLVSGIVLIGQGLPEYKRGKEGSGIFAGMVAGAGLIMVVSGSVALADASLFGFFAVNQARKARGISRVLDNNNLKINSSIIPGENGLDFQIGLSCNF